MKTLSKLIAVLVLLAATAALVWFLGGRGGGSNTEKQLYTCGMHPQVIQDHPGNCPICGMKLTPVRKQPATSGVSSGNSQPRKVAYYKSSMTPGETSANPGKDSMGMDMVAVYENAPADSSIISIDPATIQNMGIRIGMATKGPLKRKIRTVGVIDFDETSLVDVTTKYKGWIEKLDVDSTGQQVHKGEPMFEIYSPELFSAQTEYLLALSQLTNAPEHNAAMTQTSARTKLKYYDISDAQIDELTRTRQATKTLRVNAPRDGIVVEKLAVQGQMAEAGMKLYRLADLGTVWVQSQIYEQDLAFVQLGQEAVVSLSYLPDRKFRGRVTYIYPTVDEKTRTAKVRMEFHNPGFFLKPGMFATVELQSELTPEAVLVPDAAVLRSGERNTVFLALPGGRFEPRTVTIGARSADDEYQVLSGLEGGERVVISGQFMLDSESQLREAISKMSNPADNTNQSLAGEPVMAAPQVAAVQPANFKVGAYICPMPEHVAIQYDHPGKCSICGMTLIPVAVETLAKLQPGGEVQYYTCPMTDACPSPGHGEIKYDKAGKCPVCGMTLVPVMKAKPPVATPPPAGQPH